MEYQPNHEVVLTPQEYSKASILETTAEAFRNLRLEALKTDAPSFTSSYTTESQHPLSFWIKRLQNPQAKTFALVHASSQQHQKSGSASERPWRGMLVLLGPQVVDFETYDNASSWKSILTENAILTETSFKDHKSQQLEDTMETPPVTAALDYHVVSVYIAPSFRGRGLAKELITSALASVKQDQKEKGYQKAICTLGVAKDAIAARKTYESMGFVDVAEDHFISDDGREFHDSVMRKDLSLQTLGPGSP
jgi:ribosomal protein S18 acetylase RimI-like enzyme